MRAALGLARRGLGRVWPNPAVGCILAHGGRVVGRGWTQPGGRPHAETEALARAGTAAQGATAYLTLEPCAHHGRTPPCADALVAAGIARAVVAMADPDARVDGAGLARLGDAGVEVVTGVERDAALELNAGFVLHRAAGRPLVTLKVAATLDGRIATRTGASRWITGASARRQAHLLRAGHDAVAVGIGTVLADDPALTCRLPGLADRSPVRVVFDGALRLPPTSQLVRTAGATPLWVVTREGTDGRALAAAGAEIIAVPPGHDGRLDLLAALAALARRGVTRLLVEGGAALATAFVAAGRVDRLAWFTAPSLLGADARPAIGALERNDVGEAPGFHMVGIDRFDGDVLETLVALAPVESF
ncbi:MAG: bifunctional diaminohydroxyphosphoribosylaminopyrimidine deaminase/5-amino-6-(5-phosphoribosylamino)uracil reductase RibD [Alphaproteobacteria bacterium]